MLPETRLAAALCVAKLLPFLINPTSSTLAALPEVLHPTDLQMRVYHDVSVNFIPIPMLRNCLLNKSSDWFAILGHYDYRVNWHGTWGDIGGAHMNMIGHWQFDPQVAVAEQVISASQSTEADKLKAVLCDPGTGRRYISEHYERSCWHIDNWSLSRDVLSVWPDLSGHMKLV